MKMTRYACECAAHAAEEFAEEGRQDSARRAAPAAASCTSWAPAASCPRSAASTPTPSCSVHARPSSSTCAARGLTNAEIADRLVLSVRTVESHIYRAMQKLGVNDRRELPRRITA